MTGELPRESLSEFIDEREASQWSAQVVNRTEPKQVHEMITNLFGSLSIDVTETELNDAGNDLLLLLRDGEVVHSSSLDTLKQSLLLVNSDAYRTGTKSIEEIDTPDVITKLSDTVFSLRGYPRSGSEKLVLTLIARYIEQRAWRTRTGTLRASFQRLSRLNDEQGTREVYERLTNTPSLDVHVYGVPDWQPPERWDVTVHGLSTGEITRHWFVTYQSPDTGNVAMLGTETGANEWRGFWTFDAESVRELNEYIRQSF